MPLIKIAKNNDFISHEGIITTTVSFIKPSIDDLNTSMTINYTVTGTGSNEANISSSSVVIPSGERSVDIEISPINDPESVSSDREFTVEITTNASYTIVQNSSVSILIKDLDPLPAFPSAYGGGAYVTGGRGGNVYHVTSLDDDGSTGTFRWALGQSRPATIVFDVSGIIELENNMRIDDSDLTIAGQSAPEEGITITYPVNVDIYIDNPASNLILRYLRFRAQFDDATAFKVDADRFLDDNVSHANNIILDHISISYAGLQGFTVRGRNTYNITFQNGLIAESKTGSLFGEVNIDWTGESRNMTFRNSLFYNVPHRTPNSPGQNIDIYNNVTYNYINRLTTVAAGARVNHWNNYTYPGLKSSLTNSENPPTWYVNGGTNNDPVEDLDIYSTGNIIKDLFTDPNADNQYIWIEHANSGQKTRLNTDFFTDTIHPTIGRMPTVLSAIQSSTIVPEEAGAYKYLNADGTVGIYRDPQDTRYVNNTVNDTPEAHSCCNSGPSNNRHSSMDEQPYADFLTSITGTPINTRPGNFYDSNPHIPEAYLVARGITGTPIIHNEVQSSGYTLMEEYLNSVDEVVNIPQITRTDSNPTTIELGGIYTPPIGTWTDVEDGSGVATVGGDTVDVNVAGVYNVTLEHTDTDGNTGFLNIPITIEEVIGNIVYNLTPLQISNGKRTNILLKKMNI